MAAIFDRFSSSTWILIDGRINGTLKCPQLLRRRSPAAVERRVAIAIPGHPADLAENGRKQAKEKNNVSTAYYGHVGKPEAIRGNPIKRNFFDCGSGERWFEYSCSKENKPDFDFAAFFPKKSRVTSSSGNRPQLAEGLIRRQLRLRVAVVPLDDLRTPAHLNESRPGATGRLLWRPNERKTSKSFRSPRGNCLSFPPG
jgi:hypothetical protein